MKTDLVVTAYVIDEGNVLLIHHKKLNLWLPPGGHMEKDETPDDAVHREMREELGLEVEILNRNDLPPEGNIKRQLALPFYANVHSVGDHDHCSFFYLCRPLNRNALSVNKEELHDFEWFSKEQLESDARVPADVKNIALNALELFEKKFKKK